MIKTFIYSVMGVCLLAMVVMFVAFPLNEAGTASDALTRTYIVVGAAVAIAFCVFALTMMTPYVIVRLIGLFILGFTSGMGYAIVERIQEAANYLPR